MSLKDITKRKMHSYTKLKLEELKSRYCEEREKEWVNLASDASLRGAYGSGTHLDLFLEIGNKYINKIIYELFETEKSALSHEQSKPTEDNFVDLDKKILKFINKEYEIIRSEALQRFKYIRGQLAHNDDTIISKVQRYEKSTQESISRGVEMLREELRLGILQSSAKHTIHVCGDVGVVNIGTIYGSVKVKIEKLKESSKQTELVDILSLLIETIKNSTIKDEEKQEQMENVNFLVEQCEIRKKKETVVL